jgi:membrane protein YdbS with pleckstrin-like domain
MDAAVTIEMIVYVFLHMVFGVVAGVTLNCMRRVGVQSKAKAWITYIVGMAACLVTSGLIGELSKRWQVADLYKWVGSAAALLSFAAIITIGIIQKKRR